MTARDGNSIIAMSIIALNIYIKLKGLQSTHAVQQLVTHPCPPLSLHQRPLPLPTYSTPHSDNAIQQLAFQQQQLTEGLQSLRLMLQETILLQKALCDQRKAYFGDY